MPNTESPLNVAGHFNGREVHEITLQSNSGMVARILTWGAVLRDLQVPLADEGMQGVVLGFDEFAPYPEHSPYFGAVVGRYANRISGGTFRIDGKTFETDRNEAGRTTLHGGRAGFGQRVWDVVEASPDAVTLSIRSVDGDQGFPGAVMATCRYSVGPGSIIRIDYTASTDKPCPVNLTQHSYFNLDGGADISDHLLQVDADAYTPVDADLIPTGEIAPVDGTRFDFRTPRPVLGGGFCDHNLVLRPAAPKGAFRAVAELASQKSGLRMRVETTKPSLQVYDGHKIAVAVPGLGGATYAAHAGLCLETQFFPDSPNIPAFPDPILRPGEDYRHSTRYAFTQD